MLQKSEFKVRLAGCLVPPWVKGQGDPSDTVSVAAASAIVGSDLLGISPEKLTRQSPNDRALVGVAIGGSAAIGDTAINVFIDTFFVGKFYNTKLTFPNKDDLIEVGRLGWPAGAKLVAQVAVAPATNPINFQYTWEDL